MAGKGSALAIALLTTDIAGQGTHLQGRKRQLVAEAKWLPEIDVSKRLKGDIAWVKLAVNVPF